MIDDSNIGDRLDQILDKSVTNEKSILKNLVSFIDYTSLNATDHENTIEAFCNKALDVSNKAKEIPPVAAVCVYPQFAHQVSKALKDSPINTAVVATAFPSGQTFFPVKKLEVEMAINAGADEIDMVISRGTFLKGDYSKVFEEVKNIKEICGEACLKVILETGELQDLSLISKASKLAIDAGADFIKTSTGKVKPAATLEAFLVMTDAIKTHYNETGKKVGIKPAGGISTSDIALQYYHVVKENLGEGWLNKDYFRIGTSSLLNILLSEINN